MQTGTKMFNLADLKVHDLMINTDTPVSIEKKYESCSISLKGLAEPLEVTIKKIYKH